MDILIGMHATYESVDREASTDDIVRFNATATINDQPFELWSRENQATRIGVHNYGQAFDDGLVGLRSGDKKTITVDYEDGFKTADVAGKTVVFDIDVKEIRERKNPELTDELVKKIDKDCSTVKEWKEKLEKELNERLDQDNKQKKDDAVFGALLDENPIEIPSAMIDQEVNMSLMQFEYSMRQQGMDLNQYMSITNKTEEDLRNDVKESSEKRIQLRKLLEAIIEKEKITVSDDDIQTEIESWKNDTIKTIDDLKASKQHDVETLKQNLLDQKLGILLLIQLK